MNVAGARQLGATLGSRGLSASIAWRNLWRNQRRTWLSSGAIGFAVALLLFAMALQAGSYAIMIDNATGLLDGHLQLQRHGFVDDPRIESTLEDVTSRVASLRRMPDVAAATSRISAFVLVSAADRSSGARLLGVDPSAEIDVSSLPAMVSDGRFLQDGAEAFAGAALARNLGAKVGDEVLILGSTPQGGVAAQAMTLVGTFDSGIAELDRGLIEVPINSAAAAFELDDAAHAIVVRAASVQRTGALATQLRDVLRPDEVVLEWNQLVPGLEQAIELDRAFGNVLFGVLAVIVTISVFNAFVMTVFERTREFGMLRALGMRPRALIGMLQLEATYLSLIGCAVGVAIGVPLVLWLERTGIGLGDVSQMMRAFHMSDRIYPALDVAVVVKPVLLMILCTQLAGLLPALRVRRIQPAEALRAT